MVFNAGCAVMKVAASAQRDPKSTRISSGMARTTRTKLPTQMSQQSLAIGELVLLVGVLIAERADMEHVTVVVR